MKVNFTRQAANFLERLPPKQAHQLGLKITTLRANPKPPDSRTLKGYPYLRCDVGEYRIIYSCSTENDTLLIFLIGKRNDDEIYRILKRKS